MESLASAERRVRPGKTVSPRSVHETFLRNGGYFKKCKAGSLFTIKGNPQLDKENFVFSEKSEYPYFTRTVFNNGIYGYVDHLDESHLIKGNSIAVGMMGMKFFYMSHDFYAGQFTKTVFPKFEGFNSRIALWFISWFNKSSRKFLSVLVREFEKVFSETEIVIPYYANGSMALDYMESCIREMEESRICEMDAYLKVSGFENCEPTEEELKALQQYHNRRNKKVVIGTLFDIKKGKRLTKDDMIPGKINFVGSTASNNGITALISNESHIHQGNKITVTYNGSVGEAFYQTDPFWASDDVNVLYFKQQLSECMALYFCASLRKTGKKYGYAYKWTKELMSMDSIYLPVTQTGEIDYLFMETYIRALEKLTIQRVKDWRTKEISATKEMVRSDQRNVPTEPKPYEIKDNCIISMIAAEE